MNQPTPRPPAARSGSSLRAVHALVVAMLMIALVAVVACGGSPKVPSPSPSSDAAADDSPAPKPTPWPSEVIEATIAMGAADAELWKAGADIAKAANAKDVQAMWGAADGLAKLIEELTPNIAILQSYPHTKALGDAYAASFPVMHDGAAQIRDSITAGDAAGVIEGSKKLAAGVTLYGDVRALLDGYIKEAIAMKKNLVQ